MPSFETERHMEAEQIKNRLEEIRQTIFVSRHPIGALEACVTGPGLGPGQPPKTGWQPFLPHQRWGGFDQTTWFRFTAIVPPAMKGQRVVALVRPGGESLAFINGRPTTGLDDNRDEIFLADAARANQKFTITLESVPSVRFDTHHSFQYADLAVMQSTPWDFFWDATTALAVCNQLEPDSAPRRQLLTALKKAAFSVDLQHMNDSSYFESLARARRMLKTSMKQFESHGMGSLTLIGQSHIDTAWLWPLRETRRKCSRTFSTVLEYMDRYPEYTFLCSQPIQYEWMKAHYPDQYDRIRQRVKQGRWEPFGAMWVESDCNVPSGESLTRQLLFGNRFFRKEFGFQSRTAWLPDAFGYSWALPQILKKAQVDTFVTTKITWSRYTDFPYSVFQWEGADGTRIWGMMPPLNYNGDTHPKYCIEQWNKFKEKEVFDVVPFPYGYGDGGGGPTLEMLEYATRMANVTGVPKCTNGAMQKCIDRMKTQCRFEDLPVYNGEIYLEYHRGCQTTQARTKRNNRKCETLLRQTELLSTLAMLHGSPYNQQDLHDAWKVVLTNQFHDILPGSSINEVYAQADKDYAEARRLTAFVRAGAMRALIDQIDTTGEGTPLVVFNTLSWMRNTVAHVTLPLPAGDFAVTDPAGNPVPHQVVGPQDLLFEAIDLPPLGYAVYRLVPGQTPAPANDQLKASPKGLENLFVRIRFDKQGRIASVFDKLEQREIIPKGQRANVLQFFDDRPHGNDAWDIDHNFEDIMWEAGPAQSIEIVEQGPVRAIVRITWNTERSHITQDITLHAHSPRLDFVTHVDWHEKRVLMKAAFPVDIRASRATYEIQWAVIERPTHHNTAFDRARFEVPAQRWADLSEGDYGVSLLNDCKYGYDIKDNVMRLSLLRSPVDPDPHADEGDHHFTYALLPHAWSWRNGVIEEAADLNEPPLVVAANAHGGTLPATAAFAAADTESVIIDIVKKAEDSNAVIVRLYESAGQRGEAAITFAQKPRKVTECDLMEENDTPVKLTGNTVNLYVTPFEIRTLKVQF